MRELRWFRSGALGMLLCLGFVSCGTSSTATVDVSSQPAPTRVEAAETTAAPTTTLVPTTAPATTVESTTTTMRTALECASDVPLEVRVGQLLFPVVVQSELPTAAGLAARGLIGGVVVLGAPDASIEQDIDELQASALVTPAIVAVDEEGGRVQRLDALIGAVPSARAVARDLSVDEARSLATEHAERIGELGFTMNLAPVVDLDTGEFIRDRAFGDDPDLVADYAFAVADGILDAGLSPVVKHFPGHGRGTDSHTGLPTLPELDELRAADLVPFVRAIERGDLPIMVGHLVVPDLTDGVPATLSSAAIDGLLRDELGFEGLVMTDAFNMDAIAATTNNAEAAERALRAGIDLVMLGDLAASEAVVEHLVDAVSAGRLGTETIDESFVRVLDHRGIELCALPEPLRPAIGCQPDLGSCPAG